MMDAKLLAYDFDEEALEFGEPAPRPEPRGGTQAKIAAAFIGLGFLGLVMQLFTGKILGGWSSIAVSYFPIAVGAIWLFTLRLGGTIPGIKHDATFFTDIQNRGIFGWAAGIFITGFYVILYFKWDLEPYIGSPLDRPSSMLDPLALLLSGQKANQWFLYGFLYTLCVLIFGVRMLFKYRHNRYQQIRTASVMFFQFGLAFLLPNILKAMNEPEFYFTYFWPLKAEYLFPTDFKRFWNAPGALPQFMIVWGALMTFVGTPLLTWRFGKRWYCSWVCGCGGLAETLGDPFRQQSSKSTRSWKLERILIHSVLVLIIATTLALWLSEELGIGTSTAQWMKKWYGFFIGAAFSGVIGVGFYPLLGSRVWCRFGCPMAAILGIFQRTWSKFRITTNGDQCMSCGNCSTYCEMGIDVRAYAEKGENIVRASCVGCGVCSAVCPRGVLNLENGMTHADRFDGAESPLAALTAAIREGTVIPERKTMFPTEEK